MSLQVQLLLLLLAWLTSGVVPGRLHGRARHNGTAHHKSRHLADDSAPSSRATFKGDLDEIQNDATSERAGQYAGRHVKKPKVKSASSGLNYGRDGELGQIDLSLDCNDARTKLSLSDRDGPQSKGPRGVLPLGVMKSCGYPVSEGRNDSVVVKDCDVTLKDGYCSTRMKYETPDGQHADVTLPCTAPSQRQYPNDRPSDASVDSERPQSDSPGTTRQFKCSIPGATGTLSPRCTIAPDQKIPCGEDDISLDECEARNCCYIDGSCLYPMNECTADNHISFVIYGNIPDLALDLTKLRTSGANSCTPRIVTDDFVVFFFLNTDCGAVTYEVGESTVSSVEVISTISQIIPAINSNVSREMQFQMMVECRYARSQMVNASIVSAGFMVKSPSAFPTVLSEGIFSVQLQISEDQTYRTFYPTHHPPLHVLLAKPVYLQVTVTAPIPAVPIVTLLVHYCIAYPRSATRALVLLHEGCPNPNDFGGVVLVDVSENKHQRRFVVSAFQFMIAPDEYLDEAMYFMCSTELCFHIDGGCEEYTCVL